jgi:hypothetical protein
MYSRVFSEDPITKSKTIFHHDGENITFEHIDDYSDIIEANKGSMNMFDERARFKSDINRVASIPLQILFELKRKGILGDGFVVLDQKEFHRWLNDGDNKAFRTRPGVV